MTDPILVARPDAPTPAPALVEALRAAVGRDRADAAVAVRPVTDALKRVEGDRVVGDLDRGGVLLPAGPVLVGAAPPTVPLADAAGDPEAVLAALLAAGARVVAVAVDAAGGPA